VRENKKVTRRCKYTEEDEEALVEIWELMSASGRDLKLLWIM